MTPGGRRVVLVAAVAQNGVIGHGPDIPWRIPGEQASFKQLTLGHVLLMGRTTYESIGRPLPGRTTVVLTRDTSWSADGVLVAHDLVDALALADGVDPGGEGAEVEVMVAGGAQVYAAALPVADAQVLTEVRRSPVGDVHYPDFDRTEWREERREAFEGFDRVWWVRGGVREPGTTEA